MRFLSKFFRKSSTECSSSCEEDKHSPATKGQSPLIFISGSKMPYVDRKEIDRFRGICEAIGEMLGREGFGIVGCPPHVERVLASQCAKIGLLRVNPTACFSTAGLPDNRLYAQDRIRFIRRASVAVFIGGSDGTLQEYRQCKEHGTDPLIPVSGAGGAGAELARRLSLDPTDFWSCQVDQSAISVLCSPDQDPAVYANAILSILSAHTIQPKPPPDDEEPITDERRHRYTEDCDWESDE